MLTKQNSKSDGNGLTIFQWGREKGYQNKSPKMLEMDLQYFSGGGEGVTK